MINLNALKEDFFQGIASINFVIGINLYCYNVCERYINSEVISS